MTRPAGSSAGTSTADDPALPLYVSGIVDAGERPALPSGGVGGATQVHAIAEGPLAAVVSALPEGATPGRREDLEAHERVLSTIVAHATVVPMRFGVVMNDSETVRERLLRRHSATLQELLEGVRGRVQMSVKAFYAEEAVLREVIATHPEIARRAAEVRDRPDADTRGVKLWLGEMIAAEVARRRDADQQRLLDRLAPVVDDVRVEPPANERVALNAQVLVRRDGREPLDAAVRTLSEEEAGRLAFRYVGPLAPYSFADLSLAAEESPWA